jgi:hypothetical protein
MQNILYLKEEKKGENIKIKNGAKKKMKHNKYTDSK